jgi:hypothetical protein
MKELFNKYKQYLFIAIGLLVLWIVYTQFFSGGALSSLVAPQGGGLSQEKSDQILAEQAQLASELGYLDTIRFDPAFFSSAVFASLNDFSQSLPEEQIGRPNPFAPVESRSVATSSTPASTPAAPATGVR